MDVNTGAEVLEYYAHLVAEGVSGSGSGCGILGQYIHFRSDAVVHTTYEPIGVCAGIGA